jgi:hypothetical protein
MALALLASTAMGAPIPDGAQPMSREAVTKLYSGVTYIFDAGKKSSMYYDPTGEIRITERASQTGYGVGTWGVKKNGDVCIKANFKYLVGSKVKERRNYRYCSSHAITSDGLILSTATDGNWYIRDAGKKGHDEWIVGDVRKKEYMAARQRFGD